VSEAGTERDSDGQRLGSLPRLTLPLRALFTGYLLVAGVGLAMSGAQIFLTHGMADGRPGVSVDDIVYSYYGNRGSSRLEAKLDGTMKDKADTHDRAAIVHWVRDGASREAWDRELGGVFAENCVKCHGTIPGLPNFRSFEGVKPYAAFDGGTTVQDLTRLSHIHLFGIAFIFFFVCGIFSLAVDVPKVLQAAAIATPFAFLLVDISSWWLTKWFPSAAWLTIVGGTVNNLAAAFMILTSLWQMWVMPWRRRRAGGGAG
jgi:hypothetical protein